MLTVVHELRSGAALRPEFGAMYGSKNTSEARQAMAIAQRIPTGSIQPAIMPLRARREQVYRAIAAPRTR
jgi:hypothetical protein